MPRPSRRRAAAVSVMPDEAIDTLKSSFLSGVGDDAAYLADHIAARR